MRAVSTVHVLVGVLVRVHVSVSIRVRIHVRANETVPPQSASRVDYLSVESVQLTFDAKVKATSA